MKKRLFTLMLVLGITGQFLSGGCTGDDTDVIRLSYSNFFPSTHLNSVLAEKWIEEIEERTDGRVKIAYYPGGTLTPADGIFDGVEQGISDIGMSVFAYNMGRFPVAELVDLPHGYPNGWVATMAANDYYNHFQPEEINSVQPMYFHAHGPGVIITKDKKVSTLDDLSGLVLRATGVGSNVVSELGAQGYGAGQGEAYELMARGVVDGSFTPREVLRGWNQAEVVQYVTNCTEVGNTTMMYVVMNENKWNQLPEDIQQVFIDVSSEWIEKHGMVWDYYDKAGIDYFLSLGQGREVIDLSEEESQLWVETAVDPLIEKYIADKTARGHDAAEYEDYLNERVDYWSERTPGLEDSVAWVEQNLGDYITN